MRSTAPTHQHGKRRTLAGLGALLVLAVGIGVIAGPAAAARTAVPASVVPPTVTGTAQQGQRLSGDRGTWNNTPTDYNFFWTRCDANGGSCADIGGATAANYTPGTADVGNTLRFKVQATNRDGSVFSSSVPTAVVTPAAAPVAPAATTPPSVTGTVAVGQKLTGDRGAWSGSPADYNYYWSRCDASGGSCADIAGATASTHTIVTADNGQTLRFRVTARNAYGTTSASSTQSAIVGGVAVGSCNGTTGTIPIANLGSPARLQLDQQQSSPAVILRGTREVTLRYHVTACGQPVQGALVYVTVVPFNVLTIPAEQATDQNGWATLTMQMMAGYPVSQSQQLLTIFVRARKNGEDPLAGISSRRLFSVQVDLKH